jgi:hypothetical protein
MSDYFMHMKAVFLCLSDTSDPLQGFSNFADPLPKSV